MNSRPTVIVTGASRGIGAAVAQWLGSKGANVTLVARTKSDLEKIASHVRYSGGKTLVAAADVADPANCRTIVEKTVDRFKEISGLVNNAGTLTPMETVALTKAKDWQNNIEVNLLGPVFISMAAIPELRRNRGRIVNVSSGAAQHVIATASAYCSAKAGLNQFTRVLAAEEPGLTVVAVRPGVVDTHMQTLLRTLGPQKMPREQAKYYLDLKSKGQLEPAMIPARAIAWMVLHSPHHWSGSFMSYDEPDIKDPAQAAFGEKLS
jgi:NAD(P)-dependent dehydrogenase (short-subunit alcohol dehydrogenase family)